MRPRLLLLVVLSLALGAGCQGSAEGLVVSDPRVGAPTGPNAALYFTVDNHGETDRLIGASSDVAKRVEIHETTMDEDGTMGMESVAGIDIPANESVVLEPGGLHVMLLGVDRLAEGETIEVTLQWEMADDMVVTAEVVSPAETMGHEDH